MDLGGRWLSPVPAVDGKLEKLLRGKEIFCVENPLIYQVRYSEIYSEALP
jgi:hypothetical protein